MATTVDESVKKKVKAPRVKKPKDATKKPAKKERAKANRKTVTDFKKHIKRAEIMEDPDLDMEIDVLSKNGLKNQVQTLQLSRLMGMYWICGGGYVFQLNLICKLIDFNPLNFFSACQIAKSQSQIAVSVACR